MKSTILLFLTFLITSNSSLAGTKIHYVHNDHLGRPVAMTDENQIVVWKAKSTPFGETIVDEDPDGDGKNVTLNTRFPGQYYDEETGLHYNWNRYYDPETGRFITSDRIGLTGGMSTYGYALQNPINYFDPNGEAVVGGICFAILTGATIYNFISIENALEDVNEFNEKSNPAKGEQCETTAENSSPTPRGSELDQSILDFIENNDPQETVGQAQEIVNDNLGFGPVAFAAGAAACGILFFTAP